MNDTGGGGGSNKKPPTYKKPNYKPPTYSKPKTTYKPSGNKTWPSSSNDKPDRSGNPSPPAPKPTSSKPDSSGNPSPPAPKPPTSSGPGPSGPSGPQGPQGPRGPEGPQGPKYVPPKWTPPKTTKYADLGNTTYKTTTPTAKYAAAKEPALAKAIVNTPTGLYHAAPAATSTGTRAAAEKWIAPPAVVTRAQPTNAHPGFGAQRLGPVGSYKPGRGFRRF